MVRNPDSKRITAYEWQPKMFHREMNENNGTLCCKCTNIVSSASKRLHFLKLAYTKQQGNDQHNDRQSKEREFEIRALRNLIRESDYSLNQVTIHV